MSDLSPPTGAPPPPSSGPLERPLAPRTWRATRRLSLGLLPLWALIAFVVPAWGPGMDDLCRRWLDPCSLSYWFAAQGALMLFVVIVAAYVVGMERIEARHRAEASAGAPGPHA